MSKIYTTSYNLNYTASRKLSCIHAWEGSDLIVFEINFAIATDVMMKVNITATDAVRLLINALLVNLIVENERFLLYRLTTTHFLAFRQIW